MPRLRQAVLAARNLEAVAAALQTELGLGEPFADPGVEYFGLHNAVFALADTFLEVVSPVRPDTAAGRLLDRRGGDCGYMVMFAVEDFAGARERARELGVREVFEVSLDDIEEVHLHPADVRGAIVSLSSPRPPESWRWGGPGWSERSVPLQLAGATVAARDASAVEERWAAILGGAGGVRFVEDQSDRGLVEIALSGGERGRDPLEVGGVRFTFV
jgi:hypothetical protein